jgi:hypothetical protein
VKRVCSPALIILTHIVIVGSCKINISKPKVIVFSKGKRKTDNLKFYIENKKIEVVGKYKYLGVIVSYNGNLKFAAEQLCNKGLKAVFSLTCR